MDLAQVAENFEAWARTDPLWAISSRPGKRGAWDEAEFFETGRENVAHVFEHLASLGVSTSTGRALDFGCGVGRLTQALAERFAFVVGVDISPTMLALAEKKNRFRASCRYVRNESPHLRQFPDASFDFVISIVVLQHLAPPDAAAYIREFVRVLKPSGVLVFQEISERAPKPAAHDAPRQPSAQPVGCRAGEPYIQMRPLHRETVADLLNQTGATLLDAVQTGAGGPDWISYDYYATRTREWPPPPGA